MIEQMRENMPEREKYWKECTAEEKIERLRREVKSLQWRLEMLDGQMYRLSAHMHMEGQMVLPFSLGDQTGGQHRMAKEDSDDVVF